MAISITHSTPADGTFSPAGSAAWNAALNISGLSSTSGALLYSTDATTLAQSANLTFDGNSLKVGTRVQLGGTSSSFPAIQKHSAGAFLQSVVADGSAGTIFVAPRVLINSSLTGTAWTIDIQDTGSSVGIVRHTTQGIFGWSNSSNDAAQAFDTATTRGAAGQQNFGTGAAGSFAGRTKATSHIVAGVAVASLNASPTTGEIQSVTDALAPVAGAEVAAGGAAKALVWYNGAAWNVIGI